MPAGGQRLPFGEGSVVPEGTILAFNPYIINRNRDAWGATTSTSSNPSGVAARGWGERASVCAAAAGHERRPT